MPSQEPVKLEYFVVDVFTDTALAGNPLAVVMNAAGLGAQTDAGDCAGVQPL